MIVPLPGICLLPYPILGRLVCSKPDRLIRRQTKANSSFYAEAPYHGARMMLIRLAYQRFKEWLKRERTSDRQMRFIRPSKCKKGRVVPIVETLITRLRPYEKQGKHDVYLRNGDKSDIIYSKRSIQLIFTRALKQESITQPAIGDGLRHGYAEHPGGGSKEQREPLGYGTYASS